MRFAPSQPPMKHAAEARQSKTFDPDPIPSHPVPDSDSDFVQFVALPDPATEKVLMDNNKQPTLQQPGKHLRNSPNGHFVLRTPPSGPITHRRWAYIGCKHKKSLFGIDA